MNGETSITVPHEDLLGVEKTAISTMPSEVFTCQPSPNLTAGYS